MADGVLTPAVSVTSAVGGLAIAKPSIGNDITGISIVIKKACSSENKLKYFAGIHRRAFLSSTFRHIQARIYIRSRYVLASLLLCPRR